MNTSRVGRLTLAAPDEALIRRGAILLEDAMNIATLQAASDHRAYVVRHFDVGVIAEDAAPHTLALQIEQRLANVQRFAVAATSPGAAIAPAVWFVDQVTAIAELARRIVAGPRPVEWFWPHVARGAVKLSAAHALRTCLAEAARTPAGPAAVAIVVDAIETAREGALLGALQPHDAVELCTVTFGLAPPPGERAASTRHSASRIDTRWFARLVRWIARWGGDARAQWLAALAQVHTRGTVRAPVVELASAGELVASIVALAGVPARAPVDELVPTAVAPDASEEARSATPAAPARAQVAIEEDSIADEAPPPLAIEDGFASAVAGALLLVRPLGALGLAAWLDDHDWAGRAGFAAWLLAAIAAGTLAGAPDRLIDALGPDLPGVDPFVAAWAALGWTHAVDGWLREHAELSVAGVVARPGDVIATPTHLEVTWPLRAVDVRIRTVGLDVDPGWVPWLGRVVRFHYAGNR